MLNLFTGSSEVNIFQLLYKFLKKYDGEIKYDKDNDCFTITAGDVYCSFRSADTEEDKNGKYFTYPCLHAAVKELEREPI